MKINDYLGNFENDIASGHLRMQFHPVEPLAILNYTEKAQYEGHWTQATLRSRGLIFNLETMEIVARPFPKFFNWNQSEAVNPGGPVRVQEKMDGSLGILYPEDSTGEYAIATRGSFGSEQALHATRVLRTKYADFEPYDGYTYLFEIIYPENRIVVDYGDMDDLVLLDVIDNETGMSALGSIRELGHWDGPVTLTFSYSSLEEVLQAPYSGDEGFVVYYKTTGERVKVKHEEYVRLHRLITGVNERRIWEILSTGGSVESLLDSVPDEFYDWVQKTTKDLTGRFHRMGRVLRQTFTNYYLYASVDVSPNDKREHKKAFAHEIRDSDFKDVLFAMYDDKPYDEAIWKRLKPEHSKPIWAQSEVAA